MVKFNVEQYIVTGMSCAACSSRVERAVSQVPGVTSCAVSLLTNSMGVEGTASEDEIIRAVEKAGYGATLKKYKQNNIEYNSNKNIQFNKEDLYEDELKDRETPILKRRLILSLGFLIILMYFSMGHMMWGWSLPSFFNDNYIAMGLLQLLLTVIIMVINQKFFISGYKSLWHRAPNMDSLVALGSSAAFIYSTFALFAMTDAQVKGDTAGVMHYMHEFYFESAAMILALITLGKMLEARSKGKTTDALKGLMRLAPKTATLLQDNNEISIPIEQVKKGNVLVVRPGENIPVDGVIVKGNSAIDESCLTGESIPIDKNVGDVVSAGTLNQSGFIHLEATRVGEDTTLSQIIQMVSDAAATKAPIAKIADKVSGIFVPTVIIIAIITVVVWLLVGQTVGFALARGISVLVISCPCALGLATPVAIMVGNGMGAKNGILYKTAVSLEECGRAKIVALDKTGTITKGMPIVTDVIPMEGVTSEGLLQLAYSLEHKSEHPLAKAINEKALQEGIDYYEISDFKALPGNGLLAQVDNTELYGGNYNFIINHLDISDDKLTEIKKYSEKLSEEGKTPLFFVKDKVLYGIIAVADVIKEDSPQAIKEMQEMGIHVVMLTGDNEKTAKTIGAQVGVDEVIAGVLPDGKESVISELKQKGKVIMVGDGINDAPALTRADIGIAIGAGTDVAIDAADVVLMKSRLIDVPAAIRLSRATLRNIHENLFWAFIYNIIGIPLAAGVFIDIFGWQLNPMFGAAAMSLSSFCVVTNALRLNLCRMYKGKDGAKILDSTNKEKEKKNMEKTIIIEGMMCGHCEMHVKKALEAIDGVIEVEASHTDGKAIVKLEKEVAEDVLKKAVEDEGYKVIEIK